MAAMLRNFGRITSTTSKSLPLVRALSTQYGGRVTVTLLPGDGDGPEIANSVKKLFGALNVPVDFEEIRFSARDDDAQKKIQETILSLRRNGVGLKGIFSTPAGYLSRRSLNVQLRNELDLFANVIKCRSMDHVPARHQNVDLVVVRQNTEGEYRHLEHEIVPGVIESLKVISREGATRIAKFAFDYATRNGYSKVTAVHKANIMKQGDGLFLECARQVASLYPQITFSDMIVDNCCMQLVSKPQQFGVLVTPNLYGNIVGNVGAGLIGGAGIVPGFNMGPNFAVFEPGARHVDEDIAGKNSANPAAMVLSSAMMLRHLGFHEHASVIQVAVEKVLASTRTPDIGGNATTTEMTDALIREARTLLSAPK